MAVTTTVAQNGAAKSRKEKLEQDSVLPALDSSTFISPIPIEYPFGNFIQSDFATIIDLLEKRASQIYNNRANDPTHPLLVASTRVSQIFDSFSHLSVFKAAGRFLDNNISGGLPSKVRYEAFFQEMINNNNTCLKKFFHRIQWALEVLDLEMLSRGIHALSIEDKINFVLGRLSRDTPLLMEINDIYVNSTDQFFDMASNHEAVFERYQKALLESGIPWLHGGSVKTRIEAARFVINPKKKLLSQSCAICPVCEVEVARWMPWHTPEFMHNAEIHIKLQQAQMQMQKKAAAEPRAPMVFSSRFVKSSSVKMPPSSTVEESMHALSIESNHSKSSGSASSTSKSNNGKRRRAE